MVSKHVMDHNSSWARGTNLHHYSVQKARHLLLPQQQNNTQEHWTSTFISKETFSVHFVLHSGFLFRDSSFFQASTNMLHPTPIRFSIKPFTHLRQRATQHYFYVYITFPLSWVCGAFPCLIKALVRASSTVSTTWRRKVIKKVVFPSERPAIRAPGFRLCYHIPEYER